MTHPYRVPHYPRNKDYSTNAASYYDDLARKNALMKHLAQRIWEYDKELAKRFLEWDQGIAELPADIRVLLTKWIDDGTFAQLINEEIFQMKVDQVDWNLQSANGAVPLNIITDHNQDNHAVHPYVLDFPEDENGTSKFGFPYIMAFTPYSESRDRFENPSIVVSRNRYTWFAPPGLENPVIQEPPSGFHHSDPWLIDNGTDLWMVYRLTNKTAQTSKLMVTKTTDLVNWSTPTVFLETNQLDTGYVSPTGHKENGVLKMWYRNDKAVYVYTESADMVNWKNPVPVTYDFKEYSHLNYVGWHNEVKYIDGKYLSVVNTLMNPSADLFLFESTNGINFTLVKKVMQPSMNGFDSHRLYKGSLIKYGLWYYIYYSGFAADNSNHISLTKAPISTLNFTGLHSNERLSTELYEIFGANGRAPVQFPTGIQLLNGKSHAVNPGVAGYRTEVNRPDTMTIKTDRDQRPGFLEVAGVYLSRLNDSITGLLKGEGATYLHPTNHRLNIVTNNTTHVYPRMMSFMVAANAGDGVLTVYEGAEFIESVSSDPNGLRIQFKNLPVQMVTQVIPRFASGDGLITATSGGRVNFMYDRASGQDFAVIGLKETAAGTAHINFSQVTSGVIKITVIY